jgi:hypothetical protein
MQYLCAYILKGSDQSDEMPLTRVTFLINNEFPLFLRREENKSLRDRVGLSCQTGYQYLSEKKSMIRRGKSISPLASIVTSSYQSINYLKTAVHGSIVGLRFPKLVNANFIQFEMTVSIGTYVLHIFGSTYTIYFLFKY